MRYRKAHTNRLLLEAGADPNALDAQGHCALDYQSGALDGFCGYCAPDFEALDALLEGGALPPDEEQGRRWMENAWSQVCAAGEANDARRLESWIARAQKTPPPS